MSVQERLQLKRVPLDTWNIREQLCLASAVVRSGDQNWMSVSRTLKTIGEPNRPPDWYSQKSCAAQYGALLEHVETPKRKKRSSEGAGETPQESILKRLTQDRINEIQANLVEMNKQYEQIRNEINEARNPATSEERLKEIWAGIEASKRAQEKEAARRAALLKEREERRARVARSPRGSISNEPSSPTASPAPTATPAPPSSPLLTSLLKSSPVVTTPQHISHPAKHIDQISPSVTAPTLSMLLERSPQQDSKRAAIEHIKSQLVQLEQQLKANTPPPAAPLAATAAPAPLDIDDIEINAEDVYVFRDVDIHIPTVHNQPAAHKSEEKPVVIKKDDDDENVEMPVEEAAPVSATQDVLPENQEAPAVLEEIKEEPLVQPVEEETVPVEETTEVQTTEDATATEDDDIKIAFPEVKFPTTEIKVIPSDEQKIKEENAETGSPEETAQDVAETAPVVADAAPEIDSVEQQMSELHAETSPPRPTEPTPVSTDTQKEVPTEPEVEDPQQVLETEQIPLPPEVTQPVPVMPEPAEVVAPAPPPDPEVAPALEVAEHKPEVPSEPSAPEQPALDDKAAEDLKKDEDAEDSIPLQQMVREESLRAVKEDAHTETDDDTPMELSREEEKDGKKKRDYSRKKKPDSRTCSGSESAAEGSAPDSPHTSDADRHHRLWKKSVMLVYTRLCAHKYASVFLRPISDEEAPGYSVVVKRPMDLSTIRKNIENGVIKTTAEFQRDVLLMLSNALMYNSSEHSVYTMAKEMHEEAVSSLGVLLAAQAHAALAEEPAAARRKRRRTNEPRAIAHKRSL